MKKIVTTILLIALSLPAMFAQDRFKERFANRPHINPLLAGGITITGLGTGVVATGLIITISPTSESQSDNAGLYVAIAGGVMVIGGIIMICAGASQMHHKRISVISPKANEFGIAYHIHK